MNVPFIKTVRVPTPAAGAEFTMPARGGEWWRVISMVATFTTDANVADRTVTLVGDDGTDVFWRAGAAAVQAAGATGLLSATAGLGQSQVAGGVSAFPLPGEGLWLQSGWRVRSVTTNIQVGDTFTGIIALVQQFDTGPRAIIGVPIIGRIPPQE